MFGELFSHFAFDPETHIVWGLGNSEEESLAESQRVAKEQGVTIECATGLLTARLCRAIEILGGEDCGRFGLREDGVHDLIDSRRQSR